ncbi:hypothetical protein IWQ60_011135 [Tieghemiomyces parasiticus]|uniref:NuBaID C-terminal domain-containing protein n=1 Tax=Tieghemiomyces parasiticus TaxID=78921 RepID=A0A9W7ZNY3_9FUNG|nr:hypothetical protein IWQ60_011135 [Tieghemiomyces parasiticus]
MGLRYQPAEDMLEDLRDAAKVVHPQVLTTTVGVTPTHPALAAPLSPQLCRRLAALAAGKPMGDSAPSPSADPRVPEDNRGSKAELESRPLGHLSYGVTNALLHLFGWELDRVVDRDIARCPMCFRHVALWMFRRYDSEVSSPGPFTPAQPPVATPETNPHPPIVKPESPAKSEPKSDEDKGDGDDEEGDDDDDVPIKQESDVEHEVGEEKDDTVSKADAGALPPFDVIQEHRSFCYWVNPDPREAEGKSTTKLNGETAELADSEQPWQRTIRLLCNTTSESQTPTRPAVDTQDPDEVLLYVRKLLG